MINKIPAIRIRRPQEMKFNNIKSILTNNQRHLFLPLAVLMLILYLLPLFVFGEDSHILIHDCLDSEIVWMKILAESGQIFGSLDSIIPNIMNGLPRNCLGSEFNFLLVLYYIFDPYAAYIINLLFIHSTALIGMYLLLKRHFLGDDSNEFIIVGVALSFSLLPFTPCVGLTVASLPLALYSFLNIRTGAAHAVDWAIILFIPFYSSFTRCYLFFLFAMMVILVYDGIKSRTTNRIFFVAISLMTLVFLVVEYRLIYDMFLNNDYTSHRIEFGPITHCDILCVIKLAAYNFVYGQYHVASIHTYFVGLSVTIALLALIKVSLRNRNLVALDENLLLAELIIIIGIISVFYAFWNWAGIIPLKNLSTIFVSFNFTRFHWLHPLLWYIAFALSLEIILKFFKLGKSIVMLLLILQIGLLFSYSNPSVQSGGFGQIFDDGISYREFFSEDLFRDITAYIGKPQSEYRVISIGLHPSIAQYNGFYTLDSYQSNYPLEYKHKFRQIIEKELDKNDEMGTYFDKWGSRCYVFVDDIYGQGYLITKNDNVYIQNLELNITALKRMETSYVLSAAEIINNDDNNLTKLKVFDNYNSPWRIWLYKIE